MKKSVFTIVIVLVCFLAVSYVISAVNIGNAFKLTPNVISEHSGIANPININTATVQEIMLLPGIGENLANNIITYRETNGPFQSVSDIRNVNGIGTETYNRISQYITAGGQS